MNKEVLQYIPSRISPPGDTLQDLLDERGMTQSELAERTGRPQKTINEIIKGKTAITPDTALQLERVFGTPATFWSQREANYRAFLAREKESESLATQKTWLKQFPIKELRSRGWIPDSGPSVADQVISLLNYFGVASPEQWEQGWTHRRLAFRKSMTISSDLGATSVWLRQGELEAERISCRPFNKEGLLGALSEIRNLTNEQDPAIFMPKLQEICSHNGVAIVFVKPFPKVPVYGASSWISSEKALVQLSLRGKTADLLWFTIFHELGHILKHSKKEIFVEIEGKDIKKTAEENEADEFAAENLIPSIQLNPWLLNSSKFTEDAIRSFAQKIGIAPGILVGRLQHLGLIPFSALNGLKFRYEWK